MIRWLRLQWHRFTLGRTVRRIRYMRDRVAFDYRFSPPCAGTMAQLAQALDETAYRVLPVGDEFSVVMRQALDVGPGQVRIVIEVVK